MGLRGKLVSASPILVTVVVLLEYIPKYSCQFAGIESVVGFAGSSCRITFTVKPA